MKRAKVYHGYLDEKFPAVALEGTQLLQRGYVDSNPMGPRTPIMAR